MNYDHIFTVRISAIYYTGTVPLSTGQSKRRKKRKKKENSKIKVIRKHMSLHRKSFVGSNGKSKKIESLAGVSPYVEKAKRKEEAWGKEGEL